MLSPRRLALPALLYVLIGVLACSDNPEAPRTGLVRGQVTRIYSHDVIAGAVVEVGGETTTTDERGEFLIKQVIQGESTVRVSADTYQDLARPVAVGEYQSLTLELTPVDTLVDIGGLVAHRIDGPQIVRLDHAHGSVWTDSDGRWTLADAPIGPLSLAIADPRYNGFSTEVLVHTDGQEFLQTLTRDTTVTWLIGHDSYVCLRDDSLNVNRGQSPVLRVTAELGRTAVFSLTLPAPDYGWAELVAARLDLHGCRRFFEDEDLGEPRELSVMLVGLDAPFYEGAIDFYNRPGFYPQETMTLSLAVEPSNQAIVIDLLPVIADTPAPWRALGLAIRTDVEQAAIEILSGEHGDDEPEIWDRPRATYRLRI